VGVPGGPSLLLERAFRDVVKRLTDKPRALPNEQGELIAKHLRERFPMSRSGLKSSNGRYWPVASSASLQRYVRSWSTSRHGRDIRECAAATSSRLAYGIGPRSSSGSLAMLAADAPARHPLARRSDLR
jgi:hypothetical protein